MPKVNFKDVDEEKQYSLIPEGDYPAEIVKVEEKKTNKGDDMWSVQFKIIDGEYKGTTIFSFLVFNDGGYGNIKKLYKEIGGFDLSKSQNCQPVDIKGEKVIITVNVGEYINKSGVEVTHNGIVYGGFKAIDGEDAWE